MDVYVVVDWAARSIVSVHARQQGAALASSYVPRVTSGDVEIINRDVEDLDDDA